MVLLLGDMKKEAFKKTKCCSCAVFYLLVLCLLPRKNMFWVRERLQQRLSSQVMEKHTILSSSVTQVFSDPNLSVCVDWKDLDAGEPASSVVIYTYGCTNNSVGYKGQTN